MKIPQELEIEKLKQSNSILREKLREEQNARTRELQQLLDTQIELHNVLNSGTWKIMYPVRAALRMFRKKRLTEPNFEKADCRQEGISRNEFALGHIIYVSHDACRNGAQVLSIQIIRHLREVFKYNVYTILKSGGPLIDEFRFYSTKMICLTDEEYSQEEFVDWVKQTDATIAICNTVVTGDVLKTLTDCGIICLSLIHEMEGVIHQYNCEQNLRSIIAKAKKIVFASEYVRQSADCVEIIPPEKVIIQPQGMYMINAYLNKVHETRKEIRQKHHIPLSHKIVLCVAYGDHRKGIDLFAKCAKIICADIKNVTFVWVGEPEPSLMAKVNVDLAGSAAERYFVVTGWQDDLTAYYTAADLYLLTSREDPFPSVVMEAMDAYLPVIAFAGGGGYVELITDDTGTLVPMEDTEAMSAQAKKYLSDFEFRDRSGTLAHNYIRQNFNFISYVHHLLHLLDESYEKVSVIVPNYNYERCLVDRLESILNQTYPISELIILDDASTDNSVEIIKEYESKHPVLIRTILNESNEGNVFKQWAKGLAATTGDYVWIAEADDLSADTFLAEIMKRFIEDEHIVMCYSQSKMIDETGSITGDNYLSYTDDVNPKSWQQDYVADGFAEVEERLSVKNTIPNVSAAIFKNNDYSAILETAGHYKVAGDWRFYVDLLLSGGKISFVADSLNYHRRHKTSVTQSLNNRQHFDEVCEMQDYIFEKTKNRRYYESALVYREKVREILRLS